MSQEQQEQILQNSEPQSVDVTVNVGGGSRAERFLGTFDQISRLSLDIDRNYGNKRVLTDFPLEHNGSKWIGTINKLIVGFDYTITGHAYKCTDCPDNQSTTNGELNVSTYFDHSTSPKGLTFDNSGNVIAIFGNQIFRINQNGESTILQELILSTWTNIYHHIYQVLKEH